MTRSVPLISCLILFGLLLTGCASIPVYNEFRYNESVVSFADGEAGFIAFVEKSKVEKTEINLIESENTVKTLQFLEKKRKESFIAKLAAQDFDEKYFMDRLGKVFDYLSVNLKEQTRQNVSDRPKTPAIEVDIKLHLGGLSFDTTTFELSMICLDRDGNLVGKIHRIGKAIIEYPAWTFAVRPATNSAIEQLLTVLENPES